VKVQSFQRIIFSLYCPDSFGTHPAIPTGMARHSFRYALLSGFLLRRLATFISPLRGYRVPSTVGERLATSHPLVSQSIRHLST